VHRHRAEVVALYERHGFHKTADLPDGRMVMIAEISDIEPVGESLA
jgi:hypothetical protein